MGIAALVLGILSIVVSIFAGVYSWVAIIIGIVGIVLGALARKQGQGGIATAGLVCAIIGTAISVAVWIACLACAASVSSAMKSW